MTKPVNRSAITIRTPLPPAARLEFEQIMDLVHEEIVENRKLRQGPRSQAAMFVAMAKDRYAKKLKKRRRDDARVRGEARQRKKLFG